MTNNYTLSISIVCHGHADLLRNCLASVARAIAHIPSEVCVVNNLPSNEDGGVGKVVEEFPFVHLIQNIVPLGFSKNHNNALRLSSGKYQVILNDDTILDDEVFDKLIEFMDAHPGVGVVSPRLIQPNGQPQAFAFGGDPTPVYLLRRGINALVFKRPIHDWAVSAPIEVNWVSGACMMTRGYALARVGLLDENIAGYFEDNDWCLRFRHFGWKIFYDPRVSVTHLGGQSFQHKNTSEIYYASLKYFYRKHYGALAAGWLSWILEIYKKLNRRNPND